MRILCPFRIDSRSPIATIYRNLAAELSHDFFGFVGPQYDCEDEIIPIQISNNTLKKGSGYAIEYFKKYDIIHLGPTQIRDLLAIPSRQMTSAKILFTTHNVQEKFIKSLYSILHRKLLFHYASEVVSISEYVADHILETYNQDSKVIPNGVDLKTFSPRSVAPQDQRFLYVGRTVPHKNPSFIVELARSFPEISFDFVYTGQRPRYEIPNNIELFSDMSHRELADRYANATALLCPFEYEGFGMVMIEAMACGTPVIGLNCGALPEVIKPGVNGELCDCLSMDEWSTSMEQVQSNQDSYCPRETAEQYSWNYVAQCYDQLYKKVYNYSDNIKKEINL